MGTASLVFGIVLIGFAIWIWVSPLDFLWALQVWVGPLDFSFPAEEFGIMFLGGIGIVIALIAGGVILLRKFDKDRKMEKSGNS